MNLSNRSVVGDAGREDSLLNAKKAPGARVVALAGNPNVGKSTVFNSLTGLKQHTGNWPGKTVVNARGMYRYKDTDFIMVDIPGTYSLMANSTEEEIARDFICFSNPDVTVVVTDATCVERNLNLVLQAMEITDNVVMCVNLMDEARKKKIRIDLKALSARLGIPVVGTSARRGVGLDTLMDRVNSVAGETAVLHPLRITYDDDIERAVSILEPSVRNVLTGHINSRWVAIKLLDGDESLLHSLEKHLGHDILGDKQVAGQLALARDILERNGVTRTVFRDKVVTCIVKTCESIAKATIEFENVRYHERDRKIDRLLTSKITGIPIMILMLLGIFWFTITGANVPSALLADALFSLIGPLHAFFAWISASPWVSGLLVDGVYKTLAWVVSVMLPPMAIFFPLFTLLEDLGYLPRVAFNLDNSFRKCGAHGKQSLTMCMGFGCNAAGVIGCRIIDSPRERLIAILTNNFVPCNGRFPTLIAVITMFFAGAVGGMFSSVVSALLLTGVIVFGVVMTLLVSRGLSRTVLKGIPSSFQLELPPYRRPLVGQVIVRSILDRTLFVLGRAVTIAAPAGLIIWLLANIQVSGISVLARSATFLDPFAHLMGVDGYILMAFILGLPANEIVIPIIIMSYMATGSLTDYSSLAELHTLFLNHGWTWLTAICVMLFCLMHWPCGTTLLTIKKETQSLKWTAVSFVVPTVCGIVLCMLVTGIARLFGLV